MGLSCHVEAVSREEISRERADDLAGQINQLCAELDWHGGERFRLTSAHLMEKRCVSTKVAADAEHDEVWTVMCQCIAAAMFLSKRLPAWRWSITDDLDMIATSFGVDVLTIEDGRVCGDAGVHVEVLTEIGAELGEEARGRLLESDGAAMVPRPAIPAPSGPVLGSMWIEPPGEGKRRWIADVPLRNRCDNMVDAAISVSLYDRAGELITVVGVRTLGGPARHLAPGEARRERIEGSRATDDEIHWAAVTVRYFERCECPVERLQVVGATGTSEVCVERAAARVRVTQATLTIGAATAKGEQMLELAVEVDAPTPCAVAPTVRFYNAAGGLIREAHSSDNAETGPGRTRICVPLKIRKIERLGPVSCSVDVRLFVADEAGLLRLVGSPDELAE